MLPASPVLRAALHLGLAAMQVQRTEVLLIKVAGSPPTVQSLPYPYVISHATLLPLMTQSQLSEMFLLSSPLLDVLASDL